jgi:hypothetical protein
LPYTHIHFLACFKNPWNTICRTSSEMKLAMVVMEGTYNHSSMRVRLYPHNTEARRGHKSAHAFCKMKKQISEIHLLYFKIHIFKLIFFSSPPFVKLQYTKHKAINTFCVYKYIASLWKEKNGHEWWDQGPAIMIQSTI